MDTSVKILQCTCAHEYQDSKYGRKLRVFNKTIGSKRPDWRCTVCSNERNA